MDQNFKANQIIRRIIIVNFLIPIFFIQFSQSFLQIYNPAFSGILVERLQASLKPTIYALFLLALIILTLVLWRRLSPLFQYLKDGSQYEKARKATLSVPWLLIITHTSLWCLSNIAFYAAYNWVTPGGVPFFWSLSLSMLAGLLGALFTAISMNIIFIPVKKLLNITSRMAGETDYFIINKNWILMISMTMTSVLSTAYCCRYYILSENSNGLSFTASISIFSIIFSLISFMIIYLSRKEDRIQLTLLSEKLKDLNRSGGDLSGKLLLVNFDNTAVIAEEINSLMGKLHSAFSNVANAAENMLSISDEINTSIEEAAEKTMTIVESSDEVTQFLDEQKVMVNDTGSKLSDMLAGFERISILMDEHRDVIESTSATIEEMSANIESVSENTNQSYRINENLSNTVQQGSQAVHSSIQSIEEIHETAETTNDLVKMVSKIAAQTNLLAMNAAIEAAHAGDKGKGFAVVADEVRKLAGSSSENTGEISSNINLLNEKVDKGVKTSRSAGELLNQIMVEIEKSSLLAREVASSMMEQKNGTTELLKMVSTVVERSATIQDETKSQVADNGRLKENIQGFVDQSARIQSLTLEQLTSNKAVYETLTELKKLSRKGKALGEDLGSVISGFSL